MDTIAASLLHAYDGGSAHPYVRFMNQIARYGTSIAHPGKGAELAEHLLAAAAELERDPGCELYLVNRRRDAPDTIWITEL